MVAMISGCWITRGFTQGQPRSMALRRVRVLDRAVHLVRLVTEKLRDALNDSAFEFRNASMRSTEWTPTTRIPLSKSAQADNKSPMRALQTRRSRRPKLMTNNCSMALVATASCALASRVAIYFFSVSRLASQSRDWAWPFRSVSILPLIESPLILPLYLAVNLFPWTSRVTANEISSPLSLPSEISTSLFWPPRPGADSVPDTFSPSTFNLRVLFRSGPPFRPGVVHVQVPPGSDFLSWAWAAAPSARSAHAATCKSVVKAFCVIFIGYLV